MSLSNSIKKMLNIKENNFKILNIEDVKIKNIVTKQISAILSKKKANCPHCSSKKIVENNYNKFDMIMKTVLKTFKKYFEYIENSLNFEYSNARVEGSVRKIKVLKNIAYGFRSFINFKKRILLCVNF